MCKLREWKLVLVPVRATRIWPSCGRPLTPVGLAATFHCRVGVSCALPTDVCAGKRKRGDAQQPLRLHKRSAGRVLLATGGTQPPPHGSRSSRLVLWCYGNACEIRQQPHHPWSGGDGVGADVRSSPLSDHRVTTTVSLAVMALVLPSVQGGGASTRTSLAVRTDQIRGTHELQCVHGP